MFLNRAGLASAGHCATQQTDMTLILPSHPETQSRSFDFTQTFASFLSSGEDGRDLGLRKTSKGHQFDFDIVECLEKQSLNNLLFRLS